MGLLVVLIGPSLLPTSNSKLTTCPDATRFPAHSKAVRAQNAFFGPRHRRVSAGNAVKLAGRGKRGRHSMGQRSILQCNAMVERGGAAWAHPPPIVERDGNNF
jgi:hypothetical protein